MAKSQKLNREAVAKSLHQHNKRRFKPTTKDIPDSLEPTPTCDTCGESMEKNLWRTWECGFCAGYRIKKNRNEDFMSANEKENKSPEQTLADKHEQEELRISLENLSKAGLEEKEAVDQGMRLVKAHLQRVLEKRLGVK